MATVFKTLLVTRMEIQTGLSKKGIGQSHQTGKFKGGCGYEPAPAGKDSDWLVWVTCHSLNQSVWSGRLRIL